MWVLACKDNERGGIYGWMVSYDPSIKTCPDTVNIEGNKGCHVPQGGTSDR